MICKSVKSGFLSSVTCDCGDGFYDNKKLELQVARKHSVAYL